MGRRWRRSDRVVDCGHGFYAAVGDEADVEMVLVARDGELELVAEVERLAEVDASAQVTLQLGASADEYLLDRLPVDRVVYVPMQVDVGCAEWPGRARPVGRRVGQLRPG
jgi:hypothetical protein